MPSRSTVGELSGQEFRTMLNAFAKCGDRLDKSMVKAINGNQFSYRQFKMFTSIAGLKLLRDVASGQLSHEELEAVYKVVRMKYQSEKKMFRLSAIFTMAITVAMLMLTVTAGNYIDVRTLTFISITMLGIVAGIIFIMKKLMVGMTKRRFVRSIEDGYPDLKDNFEFDVAKKK